jgi:hypothetical protein
MAHIFKVYEVFADGRHHDINKTITAEYPVFRYSQYSAFNDDTITADIISKILGLYGFKSKYDYLFSLRKTQNGLYVETSTGVAGAVWYLKQSI